MSNHKREQTETHSTKKKKKLVKEYHIIVYIEIKNYV